MKLSVVFVVLALAVALTCAIAQAPQEPARSDRYRPCENKAGAGFYWVDTTCGKVWWAPLREPRWVYGGEPKDAKAGPPETYIPYENKSGAGLFILNTATGEGWWTLENEWKPLGKPGEN